MKFPSSLPSHSCSVLDRVQHNAEQVMQPEAQAFLSAFAAVATALPQASPNTAPPQRQARKLRPVQIPSEQTDNQPSPSAAFSNAPTVQEANDPFLRQLPRNQHARAQPNSKNPNVRQPPQKADAGTEPQLNNSFLRQVPHKPRRRPRRFVPLAKFETAANTSDTQTRSEETQEVSRISPLATEACKSALLAQPLFRDRITLHVAHLRAISSNPRDFFPAIKALLSCLHSSAKGEVSSLWPDCQPSQAVVYCREVLSETIPLFVDYPAPVITAFREALPDSALPAPEPSFPSATGFWTPRLGGAAGSVRALEAEPEAVSRRLQGNLETTWDQIVRLQRIYRGDMSSSPPGTFDVNVALRAMAMLHPANMDVFAARFLKLVSETGLQSRDAPLKMRQLGERLRDAPPRRHGEKGPGVVLHRLPELVRSMFEDDPTQLFFLDFLTGVDSGKLNAALVPRLVASVAKALEAAAGATTNVAFTDAVLDARLYAKLLSVTMHASNWAHSAFSLSGMDDNHVSPGLGAQALLRRVPIHSALFTTAIDLESLLRDAVASNHILPVVACVAVADVIIRLAAVDPIAKASEWYKRGLHALRSVQAVSSMGDEARMPFLHALVCAVLESEACREQGALAAAHAGLVLRCDRAEWRAIGDTRLLRVVCPSLDDLRKSVNVPDIGAKNTVRRITPQAAPDAASTLPQNGKETAVGGNESAEGGDVQAALRREFYARMDGRLRELVRVVVGSRPKSEASAREAYLKIAEMLYPETSKTVVAVAANLCEYEVGVLVRELEQGGKEQGGKDGKRYVGPDQLRAVEKVRNGVKEMEM